jgi:hypothetical protein
MAWRNHSKVVQSGTFASMPTVAVSGQQYYVTDGPIGLWVYNGSIWVPFGATGKLTQIPAVSNFTAYNAGGRTTSWTDSKGGILGSLTDGANGRDFRPLVKSRPGSSYTFTVHMWPQLNSSNYPLMGLCWRLSSNGYISLLNVYTDSTGGCFIQTNDESANNTTTSPTYTNVATTTVAFTGFQAGAGLWLQLIDNGTNRSYLYSIDGQNFRKMKTDVTTTNHFTAAPDQIGIMVGNGPGANASCLCYFDSWVAA